MAGDPADFDIRELGTLTLPMPLTLVIGYADNCGRFRDAQTLMEHVVRCFHRTPEDGVPAEKWTPGNP